jgi:hypothetical protein
VPFRAMALPGRVGVGREGLSPTPTTYGAMGLTCAVFCLCLAQVSFPSGRLCAGLVFSLSSRLLAPGDLRTF